MPPSERPMHVNPPIQEETPSEEEDENDHGEGLGEEMGVEGERQHQHEREQRERAPCMTARVGSVSSKEREREWEYDAARAMLESRTKQLTNVQLKLQAALLSLQEKERRIAELEKQIASDESSELLTVCLSEHRELYTILKPILKGRFSLSEAPPSPPLSLSPLFAPLRSLAGWVAAYNKQQEDLQRDSKAKKGGALGGRVGSSMRGCGLVDKRTATDEATKDSDSDLVSSSSSRILRRKVPLDDPYDNNSSGGDGSRRDTSSSGRRDLAEQPPRHAKGMGFEGSPVPSLNDTTIGSPPPTKEDRQHTHPTNRQPEDQASAPSSSRISAPPPPPPHMSMPSVHPHPAQHAHYPVVAAGAGAGGAPFGALMQPTHAQQHPGGEGQFIAQQQHMNNGAGAIHQPHPVGLPYTHVPLSYTSHHHPGHQGSFHHHQHHHPSAAGRPLQRAPSLPPHAMGRSVSPLVTHRQHPHMMAWPSSFIGPLAPAPAAGPGAAAGPGRGSIGYPAQPGPFFR
mmetsp:Transcript_26065/g.74859  ORF Transcript_26065/g.74859 Transcript_26065/m.74859 type:complete len:512 (-) Transcript_26065:48-1583(-)